MEVLDLQRRLQEAGHLMTAPAHLSTGDVLLTCDRCKRAWCCDEEHEVLPCAVPTRGTAPKGQPKPVQLTLF